MIITKEQFEKDILALSKFIGLEKSYEIFIETKQPGLTRLVEMIVYDLFINQFDYRGCNGDLYYSYRNLLEYSKELKENGFINFK
jgi:hypothetical protein